MPILSAEPSTNNMWVWLSDSTRKSTSESEVWFTTTSGTAPSRRKPSLTTPWSLTLKTMCLLIVLFSIKMLSEEFTPMAALLVPPSLKRIVGSAAFSVKISVGDVVPIPTAVAVACNACDPLGRKVMVSWPKSIYVGSPSRSSSKNISPFLTLPVVNLYPIIQAPVFCFPRCRLGGKVSVRHLQTWW